MTDEQNRTENEGRSYEEVPPLQTDDLNAEQRAARLESAPQRLSVQDDGDHVVREYEQRYRPSRIETPPGAGEPPRRRHGPAYTFEQMAEKAKRREIPLSYSTMNLRDEEKQWAAIAHASIWASILAGLFSGGVLLPVTVFIPLIIYFAWRGKSDYVAFHALQAFVLQLLATVGVAVLATVGAVLWVVGLIVAALSLLVLIGIVLLPVWLIVGAVFFTSIGLSPIIASVVGTVAALETYRGRDYQLPFIARWIDRQLAGSYIKAV